MVDKEQRLADRLTRTEQAVSLISVLAMLLGSTVVVSRQLYLLFVGSFGSGRLDGIEMAGFILYISGGRFLRWAIWSLSSGRPKILKIVGVNALELSFVACALVS